MNWQLVRGATPVDPCEPERDGWKDPDSPVAIKAHMTVKCVSIMSENSTESVTKAISQPKNYKLHN